MGVSLLTSCWLNIWRWETSIKKRITRSPSFFYKRLGEPFYFNAPAFQSSFSLGFFLWPSIRLVISKIHTLLKLPRRKSIFMTHKHSPALSEQVLLQTKSFTTRHPTTFFMDEARAFQAWTHHGLDWLEGQSIGFPFSRSLRLIHLDKLNNEFINWTNKRMVSHKCKITPAFSIGSRERSPKQNAYGAINQNTKSFNEEGLPFSTRFREKNQNSGPFF